MRVLLVTNGLRYGGAERIVEALATGLTADGDVVSVAATTRGGPLKDTLRQAGIQVSVLHIGSAIDARVPLKLAQVARRFRPDVIHSHLAVADIATALAAPLLPGVRRVTTVHNTGVELDPVKLALWRTALTRFHRVIAVSEVVAGSLWKRLNPVVVRPSLVEVGAQAPDRASARRALEVDDETRLVLGVGRLTPIKGYDVLARAAERVQLPRTRFLLIGEGEERPRLEGTRLELVGPRADAASLLAAADVVVCPSRSEGLPQIPVEAMAARRPVVATRVGGTPEVVVHEQTGLLVPSEDPGALAAALETLLNDPSRAGQMGQAGYDRLSKEGLTRSAMIRRTRNSYENSA